MAKVAELHYDEEFGYFKWTFGNSLVWESSPGQIVRELTELAASIKEDMNGLQKTKG